MPLPYGAPGAAGQRGAGAAGLRTAASGRPPLRAELPLLDRLMEAEAGPGADRALSAAQSVSRLRDAVARDLEALLNARRPWCALPADCPALPLSPLGYGIPDFAAGAFNDPRQRDVLRVEIEEAIRRFEPRLVGVRVRLLDDGAPLRRTLRLRIEALLRVPPAPEPISFDTAFDPTSADIVLHALPSR